VVTDFSAIPVRRVAVVEQPPLEGLLPVQPSALLVALVMTSVHLLAVALFTKALAAAAAVHRLVALAVHQLVVLVAVMLQEVQQPQILQVVAAVQAAILLAVRAVAGSSIFG
jgi:hypothetical protein